MGDRSKIEWTQATWNPIRGCSMVSAGCENCYAMKQAHRFAGPGKAFEGLTEIGPTGPRWTGSIRLVPELLDQPLRWKKPRMIFVNSMSDLFHEDVPDNFIMDVWIKMQKARHHTFQILTKRPERMQKLLSYWDRTVTREPGPYPLPNVWLGVSVEGQKMADERIPVLLQTPAMVRWVSAEPLLGPINFCIPLTEQDGTQRINYRVNSFFSTRAPNDKRPGLHWVIVGGESGPHARPCQIGWIRDIINQCKATGVPCFVKQLGKSPEGTIVGGTISDRPIRLYDHKGGDPSEWPSDIRVREFPR